MYTVINGKTFKVKRTGTRYFYWSYRVMRWLTLKQAAVSRSSASDERGDARVPDR